MSFGVYLHPRAVGFLNSLDSATRERIKSRLRELAEGPNKKGRRLISSPFFRMRIGRYRAIYKILWNESRVNVLFIDLRDRVYDDFKRILL